MSTTRTSLSLLPTAKRALSGLNRTPHTRDPNPNSRIRSPKRRGAARFGFSGSTGVSEQPAMEPQGVLETLSRVGILSVVLIALGIMSLTLTRGASGFREPKAILYALGTGVFIAGYTVVDGLGGRLADSAHSYVFWLNLFDGIPITILAFYLRRDQVIVQVRASWKLGVLAGIISLLAYWIVIWAMTQAPMALVSAVRETSMVFAVLFGVFFLKERLNLARLASMTITLFGAVMLKMSK